MVSALKKRFQAVVDRAFGTAPLKEYVRRVFLESRQKSKPLPGYLGINLERGEWGVFDREKVEETETELLLYLSTEGSLSCEDLDFWRTQIRVFYGQPEVDEVTFRVGQVIPFKRPARHRSKRPTAKRR
ncbi:MAG: hypothetical protein HYT40_04000 [Candidatus Sungbacteria bacterium]|uniref:Uncharacterized protein n=1 Tax=Candidatus Sungiibacteriota bacterium TaxID=2750080 RepID=A0A931SC96_9BACT|nr:hypothetical protein [Candidatus Sungbacteria bacterium]